MIVVAASIWMPSRFRKRRDPLPPARPLSASCHRRSCTPTSQPSFTSVWTASESL